MPQYTLSNRLRELRGWSREPHLDENASKAMHKDK